MRRASKQSRRVIRLGNSWAAAVSYEQKVTEKEKREKKMKRFHQNYYSRRILIRSFIPATWDRAALCLLCAEHTTGGSTTGSVRVCTCTCTCMYVAARMLCTTSCRVVSVCFVLSCVPRVGMLVLVQGCMCSWCHAGSGLSSSQGSCMDGNTSRMRVLGVAFLRFCSVILTGTATELSWGSLYLGRTGRRAPSQLFPFPSTSTSHIHPSYLTTCECGDMGMISNPPDGRDSPQGRERTVAYCGGPPTNRATALWTSSDVFCWSLHLAPCVLE
jgi:hypothetical protein